MLSEREAEILKPLSSVEVVEKEEATFDTEISEDDVVGEWKLRGQVLTRSPVRVCLWAGIMNTGVTRKKSQSDTRVRGRMVKTVKI